MRDIGKNIRAARLAKQLTQDDLAERLHTTRQTVSNYETGRSRPDVEMLMQIAQVLEVEVTTLLYGTEQSPRQKKEVRKFWVITGISAALIMLILWRLPLLRERAKYNYDIFWMFTLRVFLVPLLFSLGYGIMQGVGVFLGAKPLRGKWVRAAHIAVTAAALALFLPLLLVWSDAVAAQLGLDGWDGSLWPLWVRRWMTVVYVSVSECRIVALFLGMGVWATKRTDVEKL